MALPLLKITLTNEMYGFPEQGNLVYQYNPFQNLQNPIEGESPGLVGLTMSSFEAGIKITEPITMDTEVSYDDSINIVLTDETNPQKIVNSRFYQTSTMTYNIADRKGNLDTNIYNEKLFKVEAGLIKSVRTIATIDFLGIRAGGKMPIGNYTFYFKLADADGNESDFIAESGKVICHIGAVNSPKSIRGGQQDENSYKVIKFKLNNLDLAYDYIHVYYTRSTGDGDTESMQTYKISDKFKITNRDVELSITGYENHEQIAVDSINIQYSYFDSVKSLANCQNISFAGNVTNDYEIFKTLEKYSLYVTPEVVYDTQGIGNLNHKYEETYGESGNEYYNAKNIYYKLGLWDEEIYRVGIVYILNNYTLSPVFNIRGRKIIGSDPSLDSGFKKFKLSDPINYTEDYLVEGSNPENPENVKGVFKIDSCLNPVNNENFQGTFDNNASIKPLGLKFNFTGNVIDGIGKFTPGLKDLTKGFFIVRQRRIPTILAQAVGIGTTKKGFIPVIKGTKGASVVRSFFGESFLTLNDSYPKLSPHLFSISDDKINENALLCPEASLRTNIFNTFFNSTEYLLKASKYNTISNMFSNFEPTNSFVLQGLIKSESIFDYTTTSELTLIEPSIELIKNSVFKFSSKAGDAIIPAKHSDPILGNYEDPEEEATTTWNSTDYKIRGIFNTYIGCSKKINHGRYYNIFQKDYNFTANWKDYFLLRYNDSSPFQPIGDRTEWSKLIKNLLPDPEFGATYSSENLFRGDCYINTYTQRMHWNFIDPDLPTNKRIVDRYTWAKNVRISKKASIIVKDSGDPDVGALALTYNKLLPLFTYKQVSEQPSSGNEADDDTDTASFSGLLEPDAKRFKKYSGRNGLFGTEKVNRPDINAVPLGHWVTFKICSNINLAMRDLDFTQPFEEALHGQKRGFFPLQSMDVQNPLPESNIINNGISKSLGNKYYFEVPDVPFIKTNFATRIHYSNLLQSSAFTNGNRIFEASNYLDYPREYGALVKLIEWYGRIIAVLEHGVIMIPINERAMMQNASGENIYINTDNILPKNPKVLSNTFGSLWPEAIIKTSKYIYGIDTVGKKIWRTNGEQFENISDLKVQKFLNDRIILRESDKDRTVNSNFIKAHYNAFKHDILFTFHYEGNKWNLCWNELLQKWVTQYTWFPEFSENINNIFYTFANQEKHLLAENKLYKHGFAGTEEELGDIKPTFWYGEQHPFEYEFVISTIPGIQKIYNNLKIISNLAEPESFYYEVVGEGYSWFEDKNLIVKLNNTMLATVNGVNLASIPTEKTEENVKLRYQEYLLNTPNLKKLPYIYMQSFDVNDPNSFFRSRGDLVAPFNMSILRDLTIREHNKTKEKLVVSYQKGADIKVYGRRKGNMQYLEDCWDVQIQPLNFQYAYILNSTLAFTQNNESEIRDKYLKIRVKYKGDEYAIINALRTLFTISYA